MAATVFLQLLNKTGGLINIWATNIRGQKHDNSGALQSGNHMLNKMILLLKHPSNSQMQSSSALCGCCTAQPHRQTRSSQVGAQRGTKVGCSAFPFLKTCFSHAHHHRHFFSHAPHPDHSLLIFSAAAAASKLAKKETFLVGPFHKQHPSHCVAHKGKKWRSWKPGVQEGVRGRMFSLFPL